MSAAHTPTVLEGDWNDKGEVRYSLKDEKEIKYADVDLINEAFAVRSELNLTPRQLADELVGERKLNNKLEQIAVKQKAEIQTLTSQRNELLTIAKIIADIPLEAFDKQNRSPDEPLMAWQDHKITIGDVLKARATITKAEAVTA